LENVLSSGQTRRQTVDIPPVKPEYPEHRSHHKVCPSCGKVNTGSIDSILEEMSQKSEVACEAIRERILESEVVEEYFPGGFLHSFYVSDCWASQLKTAAKAHQFRNSERKGAERFAGIRSVIDTTLKNGQDVFFALKCLANIQITNST
jgi:hypothetical protein